MSIGEGGGWEEYGLLGMLRVCDRKSVSIYRLLDSCFLIKVSYVIVLISQHRTTGCGQGGVMKGYRD